MMDAKKECTHSNKILRGLMDALFVKLDDFHDDIKVKLRTKKKHDLDSMIGSEGSYKMSEK